MFFTNELGNLYMFKSVNINLYYHITFYGGVVVLHVAIG